MDYMMATGIQHRLEEILTGTKLLAFVDSSLGF
jgi:hypothetical protein